MRRVGASVVFSTSLMSFLVLQTYAAFGLPAALHPTPLLAISLFTLLSAYLQWGRWLVVAWGWTYLASWFMEYLGVNYGVVFGHYEYSHLLGPKLFGVPLLIPHLWFVVVYTSYLTAGSRLGAAVLAALWDLAYDPLFALIGLWRWEGGAVPYTNFLGWLITAGVVSILFKPVKTTTYESTSYFFLILAYIPLAVKYGLFWSVATALIAVVIALIYRKRLWRHVEERRAFSRTL